MGKKHKYSKIVKDKKLWLFMGSGLIVSVAYIDPGNWGTNIAGGSSFNYDLLWVIWMASGMAMLFQYLSGKLGVAGYSLPQLVKQKLKYKSLIIAYWLLAEIAILATDLAEFLGIAVALNLLLGIPLLWGAIIGIADVFFILLFTQKRFRILEKVFIGFIGIIGLSFIYEVFISKPDVHLILLHSIKPILTSQNIFIAVGIIGATVMPHALFVHSWLVKNKKKHISFKDRLKILRYHRVDNIISLSIAGVINAAMLIMAAAAFYGVSDVVTLGGAYKTLIPLFGNLAAFVFAIALLVAGISSSITATLAGESIMEGLTGFKIKPWVRRVITRLINMVPLIIAIILGIEPLKMLIYSQAALSFLLPLPLIPLIMFTADKKLMKELTNKRSTTIIAIIFACIILLFNFYLLYHLLV